MALKRLLILACCLGSLGVVAQEEKTVNVAKDVEVIEVVAQFSKAQWKSISEHAKVDFYALFNKYNTIDKFKMVCKPTAPIGSKIKRNICEPQYFRTALAEDTQITSLMSGGMSASDNQKVVMLTKELKQESDAHMEALINEHPDLRKKFMYYAKAKRLSELRDQMD